jgi:hypothetical protein
MNQVTNRQSTDVSTNAGNPFTSYGDQVSQKQIVGTLLRFSKGDYLAGQEDEEVPVGTKYVANMDELMAGWIRWADNKPTDHIMGKISESYQAPKRNTLGDTDKAEWEVDSQGKERDPWQFSNYLLLWGVDDAELYTFATSSRGGLNAIGDLCKVYGKQMAQHPDEFPIIEMGVTSYNHPNKEFGRIKVPVLKIVGWENRAVFADGVIEDGGEGGEAGEGGGGEVTETKTEAKPAETKPATAAPAKAPTAATTKAKF